MSMFISKALRRAEVFLEQVDESVAQASRRLVVEGATRAVDEEEEEEEEEGEEYYSENELNQQSRASAIPRAEQRAKTSFPDTNTISDQDDENTDGWGDDVHIDDTMLTNPTTSDQSNNAEITQDVEEAAAELMPEPPIEVEKLSQSKSRTHDDSHVQQKATSLNHPNVEVEVNKSKQVNETLPKQGNEYIQALETENGDLRKEFEQLETEYDKVRKEKGKLVKNLKRMKDIVNEMDETLREKSAEARSLESELMAASDKISSLEAESAMNEARGKDGMDALRKEMAEQIGSLEESLAASIQEGNILKEENERLNEALLQGHEVDLATADGAREEATKAHRAYEAEALAHRETRKLAKEREEALQTEAALATKALADAQRKAEECTISTSNAKSSQRAAEAKLQTVANARDAAFARIEDLEQALSFYEDKHGKESPRLKESQEMQETIAELENALEAKNVELNRLEGEVEGMRASMRPRKDVMSPRASARQDAAASQEVELKLRHMADATLRKQAQLEVLRSENRTLQHQLNTERKRTREAQAMAAAASTSRSSIRGGFRGILDTGEDERGERMYGVRDGPLARFRTPRSWPRSVSKVIIGLDQFSAHTLAFLRKEPLLRLVLLLYMAGMHLFVYSILHWHVDAVSGGEAHGSIASANAGVNK
ncbi:Golgin-84 [Gracilariopsis chorda]|uniref:Golgin-84 n=1 Tax=Gracilariopsis chorda TaxID=448386 RepID=A0A2V3J3A6_9FLOR|nr:Golgin-84 [Gracilariopsis chorda]|eukprot:PXF48477.1 Golgin-84 [Gracilariopsis chorda]